MGTKIFFTGIFIALLLPLLPLSLFGLPIQILGAAVGLLGIILIWLDK